MNKPKHSKGPRKTQPPTISPQINKCRFIENKEKGFSWATGVATPLVAALISSGLVGGPISYFTQKYFNYEDRKWKLVSSFGESFTTLELCAKSLDSQFLNLIDQVDRLKPNQALSETVLNSPFEKIKICSSNALSLSLLLSGLKEQNTPAQCLYDNLQNLDKSIKFEIGQAMNGKKSPKPLLVVTEPAMSDFRSNWKKCSMELRQVADKIASEFSN